MARTSLPPQVLIPVRPILVVGASVDSVANFMEAAGGGLVSTDPPMIALPLRHERYTLKGIMQYKTFSVAIPSVDQVKETDYCGMVSGTEADKVKACRFNVFYGKLASAPMIEQYPVNMECSVVHILSTESHAIVIGKVEGTYVADEYLKDGKLDIARLNELLWSANTGEYITSGKVIGRSRSMGKDIKSQ